MIRRYLSTFAFVFLASTLLAEEPKELMKARTEYQHATPGEAARSAYVTQLTKLRDEFVHANKTAAWQAIDAEMIRNPVPKNADSKALSNLLIGQWKGAQHEYLYKKDGLWTMIPEGSGVLHGRWRIEGNQIYSWLAFSRRRTTEPHTLILLDGKNLVCADKVSVFYETRVEK